MSLILLGYMGSGKSSIGHDLAKKLKYDYVDLDAYIVKMEAQSIPEIFKSKGEIYFRKLEAKYLRDVLKYEHSIISLGGGTPCYGHNMTSINESPAKSIYLRAKVSTLSERIFPERFNRPLVSHLSSMEDLQEFVGKHLFERSQYYMQAQMIIDTDSKSVEMISQEIISALF